MICHDLNPFFDGELAAEEQAAFRDHLADCKRCQHQLAGRMHEAIAVEEPVARAHDAGRVLDLAPRLAPRSGTRRRVAWIGAAVGVAAMLALVVWWMRGTDSPSQPTRPAIVLAPKRGVDVRFGAADFDRYRERSVVRAGSRTFEEVSLAVLGELDRTGDRDGLIAASALNGDLARARRDAEKQPDSCAKLTALSALALLDSDAVVDSVPKAQVQAAAERALALAVDARTRFPDCTPAMWNEAVALERLQLPLAAAVAFERVAARSEPGWSVEAAERAGRLRGAYREEATPQESDRKLAGAMVKGGPIISAEVARRIPSILRSSVVQALAATADPDRMAALRPLAATLGISSEIDRAAAGDVAVRAPLAAMFAAAIAAEDPVAFRRVRLAARKARVDDIARATLVAIDDREVRAEDLDALAEVRTIDPWWNLLVLERLVFFAVYRQRAYASALTLAGPLATTCDDVAWCPRIHRALAAAGVKIGRLDLSYSLIALSRAGSRRARDLEDEGNALSVLGQTIVLSAGEFANADAYLSEAAGRYVTCEPQLYRLDFLVMAALDAHRHDIATQLLAEADVLDQNACKKKGVRFNAELSRVRLIMHAPSHPAVTELERRLVSVEQAYADLTPPQRLYMDFMRKRARLAVAASPDMSALQALVARADALPRHSYTTTVRSLSLAAIAEHAAQTGDAERTLVMLASRMSVDLTPGCVVGISHDDRVTVIVRGADGRARAAVHDILAGQRVATAEQLLPPTSRELLVGCEQVAVLATGPYFGMPRLLDDRVAWAYRSSRRPRAPSRTLERQVIVTDVQSPSELRLPALRRMDVRGARILAGSDATPARLLEAMRDTELVVINAHGVVDASDPAAASLVLSPGARGEYALTAEMVRVARFEASPVVVLAACHAGRTPVSDEPWSLASSFLAAGASAVVAPTTEITDDIANEVFEAIRLRMREGVSAARAVAEQRERRGIHWISSIVVFE